MPNRLRYHERRLIARGLAKESDFRKVEEKVEAPKVVESEENKEGILDKLKITKQED
jgi:hypothetical protein